MLLAYHHFFFPRTFFALPFFLSGTTATGAFALVALPFFALGFFFPIVFVLSTAVVFYSVFAGAFLAFPLSSTFFPLSFPLAAGTGALDTTAFLEGTAFF